MVQVTLVSVVDSPVVGDVVRLLTVESIKPCLVTIDCGDTVTRPESRKIMKVGKGRRTATMYWFDVTAV